MAAGIRNTGNGRENSSDLVDQIIDLSQVREKRMVEKRRQTERIIFENLLRVYSIVGRSKMCPITLIDLSEDGCSFQIPSNPENPWPKDTSDLPLRFYFSNDTYLEIVVKIQNSIPFIDSSQTRSVRYGCSIDKNLKSYPAYQLFVQFLKLYGEHAHKDLGDTSIFYL